MTRKIPTLCFAKSELLNLKLFAFFSPQLRYWISNEGFSKKKEVEIIMGDEAEMGGGSSQPIKVALSDLPAYMSLQAQVAVVNSHYTGPFSKLLEFFTPEGCEFLALLFCHEIYDYCNFLHHFTFLVCASCDEAAG